MTNPRFPLYIPSKGRYATRHTVKSLDKMGVTNYRLVVERQEYADYAAVINPDHLLVLDPQYQADYDTCDDLGATKTKGSGPARNFIWDHAVSEGHDFHWIMDDNIDGFYRFNRNLKVPCESSGFWRAMEDFVLRYENIAMAGPNYEMFVIRKTRTPPFYMNTRIYSCNLIRNDVPFRWRGRYNEDTILSLDMLKAGWCTVLFNTLLAKKLTTQKVKGGNTDELYKDGTLAKSQMQVNVHPDVSKISWRFGRWHHHVDYRPFKNQSLKRKPVDEWPSGVDNFGMRLRLR